MSEILLSTLEYQIVVMCTLVVVHKKTDLVRLDRLKSRVDFVITKSLVPLDEVRTVAVPHLPQL